MSDEITSAISDEQVVAYLKNHPDFFEQHLDLLEVLHIPHPSGSAVSLIAKQLELFRSKHKEQENQLIALIDIARENDASFNGMHELSLAMLEANSLEEVIANLSVVMSECFMTDFVSVRIIGHQDDAPLTNLYVAPDDEALGLFQQEIERNQPKCGRPTLAQARFLFGDAATEVRSCAIIPMMFTRIEGLIAIGSRDEGRFHYSMGTLFLSQMSEIVGTRLIALLADER